MDIGLVFIYCEFMIDYWSLQRKDNVAYESNTHSLYVFCLLQRRDNVPYESNTHSIYVFFFLFVATKREFSLWVEYP